ncbi:MAG: hypothetical protein ABI649_05860 [Gaiellaceae bacterium]
MDEARHVLERLERIDALRREGAPAAALLGEVRGLLREGERWLAAERPDGIERARAALDECRAGLAAREEVVAPARL